MVLSIVDSLQILRANVDLEGPEFIYVKEGSRHQDVGDTSSSPSVCVLFDSGQVHVVHTVVGY